MTRDMFNWRKCDKGLYQLLLDTFLGDLNECPIENELDIETLYESIFSAINKSMNLAVPKIKFRQFRRPFWDNDLKSVYLEQKTKRLDWINAGRPRSWDCSTYAQYKTAKSKFRKMFADKEQKYQEQNFLNVDNDFEMDSCAIWKYLKSSRNTRESLHSILLTGERYNSPDELRTLWRKHFCSILNESQEESELFDCDFQEDLVNVISDMERTFVKDNDNTGLLRDPFSDSEIRSVCMCLPTGKAPGVDNVSYEALKYGTEKLFKTLNKLFNGMTMYTYIPNQLKISVIIPLYKGKNKPKDDINSYRGVSLMPVVYKVYEKLLYNRIQPWLEMNNFPPNQQHAGRKGHSSITVSYAIQEAINYHTNGHSRVYGCMMDLKQALDKVSWNTLLYKFGKIGVKDKLWWIFRNSPYDSVSCVLLNGTFSERFTISRSIKQGGMLSMLYFIVSYYDIHDVVSSSGDSLKIHGQDFGSMTLADDTFLLSNTVRGLQNMIDLAVDYAKKWKFIFSPSKTKCVTFGESRKANTENIPHRQWYMNGSPIEEVQNFTHVGVRMCSYGSTSDRTKVMCRKGFAIYGTLLSCGLNSQGLSPLTSSHVWHRMACPSMLYSCELWGPLKKNEISKFERVQTSLSPKGKWIVKNKLQIIKFELITKCHQFY